MRSRYVFIIMIAAWLIGIYCGMSAGILALLATIPGYLYLGAQLAGAFLWANPLIMLAVGVGLTAGIAILYYRHEWGIFDKIRGKTTATTTHITGDEFSSQALRDQQAALAAQEKEK